MVSAQIGIAMNNLLNFFVSPLIFRIFIVGIVAGYSNPVWSSAQCNSSVSISSFNENGEKEVFGPSIAKILEQEKIPSTDFQIENRGPFLLFANEIETFFLSELSDEFCAQGFKVELNFILLEMLAADSTIAHVRKRLADFKGSYVDIDVENASKTVKVIVVWNPRRMLRDQLTLSGWKFKEELPLLPFSRLEFHEFIKKFAFIHEADRSPESAARELRGTVPDDMFGLLFASWNMRPRIPAFDSSSKAVSWLLETTHPGHTAIAKFAASKILAVSQTQLVISILDTDDPAILELYRTSKWFDIVEPF